MISYPAMDNLTSLRNEVSKATTALMNALAAKSADISEKAQEYNRAVTKYQIALVPGTASKSDSTRIPVAS